MRCNHDVDLVRMRDATLHEAQLQCSQRHLVFPRSMGQAHIGGTKVIVRCITREKVMKLLLDSMTQRHETKLKSTDSEYMFSPPLALPSSFINIF